MIGLAGILKCPARVSQTALETKSLSSDSLSSDLKSCFRPPVVDDSSAFPEASRLRIANFFTALRSFFGICLVVFVTVVL